MRELLAQIDRCIQKRQLVGRGRALVVAVSGGLDSMVLLHLLHRLSERHGWSLTAAHFNHCLRGASSDADQRLVVRTARKLRLPVVTTRGDVRAFSRASKVSIEMAARELRHKFLASVAHKTRATSVALAHHADDQLELFFLRLLRGSGGDGLSAMKWRAPSPADGSVELVRPLLEVSKDTLLQYARAENVPFREDTTNASLDFQRNRIRHELLPLLKSRYQPNLEKVVSRIIDITSAEADLASAEAGEWLKQAFGAGRFARHRDKTSGKSSERRFGTGRTIVEASAKPTSFSRLPVAVQRRCIQFQLFKLGVRPEYELIERLRLQPKAPVNVGPSAFEAGADESSHARVLTRDTRGLVQWQKPSVGLQFGAGAMELDLEPAAGQADFAGLRLKWSIKTGKFRLTRGGKPGREVFDADKVGSPILLRFWRPGDRFQPIGMHCSVKLQDFLTNQKVPATRRRDLILAATGCGEVFWVEGQRISERFKLTETTIRRLHWSWQRL